MYLSQLANLLKLELRHLGRVPAISDRTCSQLFQLAEMLWDEILHIILVLCVLDEAVNLPMVEVVLEAPLDHFTCVLSPVGEHRGFLLKLHHFFIQLVLLMDYHTINRKCEFHNKIGLEILSKERNTYSQGLFLRGGLRCVDCSKT